MIAWTAFLLGLVGSLHCAGMCGPLALALPTCSQSTPGFLAGRFAYNLGRLVTYCALGLVFGLLGRTLVLAGLFSSQKLALWRPVSLLIERLKSHMSFFLRRRSMSSLALLGLLNGLLPCGLVYVACA